MHNITDTIRQCSIYYFNDGEVLDKTMNINNYLAYL